MLAAESKILKNLEGLCQTHEKIVKSAQTSSNLLSIPYTIFGTLKTKEAKKWAPFDIVQKLNPISKNF
jgi:hypothetical protein